MIKKKLAKFNILLIFCMIYSAITLENDQFTVHDYDNEQQNQQQQDLSQNENSQRQMQYMSQRRTACLVLSRYYANQFNEDINNIIRGLSPQDQQKFINKLYATAIQKCQPIINQMQIMQFFSASQNFDPSSMFHIFEGFNFHEVTLNLDQMSQNQQNIVKFIKNFDSQMQIRKEQQNAKKVQEQRDQGISVFFVSMKNLPPQMKYLYIVLVILISGGILWYGFSQIGKKPEKKPNKRRKKQ